ncbi:MAG: murein transglycosylase [Rhodobacteraceae bacterium]|mgnify:CR=1 FL=1|jgi:membrane-bound lytic murein transglycosylase A|nr:MULTISPECIES: MltA domain-containing protein [Salipiger]MAB05907.1 murein transglycosylase [Paracoccaceae bacterium]GGA10406.1 murein transglycosylase [Salipiger profundus]SFC64630.1 membrane-bound lytic murein transglycosylase A [Salipiger profundus]
MWRRVRAACVAGMVLAGSMSAAETDTTYEILGFEDLDGWADDDHAAALAVFLETCGDMRDPDWSSLCAVARETTDARDFFELFFRPVMMKSGGDGLFTGYFEPELDGALEPSPRYRYPLYRMPPEAQVTRPWLTRREILTSGVMEGRDLEIAWVDDPVELFFLQIQGSGRVRLPDGSHLRVGYGGANGHPYSSIGKELIRRGTMTEHEVSAQGIKSWVRGNPFDGEELLFHNDSYVFFREVNEVPPERGPLGAMNRSITAMRSIAVDPAFTPLGAPVWIEKDGAEPMRRLMIAQDTGSAIKGAQRADIFFGTGAEAGSEAGKIKDAGRLVVLLPIQRAYALLPESVL